MAETLPKNMLNSLLDCIAGINDCAPTTLILVGRHVHNYMRLLPNQSADVSDMFAGIPVLIDTNLPEFGYAFKDKYGNVLASGNIKKENPDG